MRVDKEAIEIWKFGRSSSDLTEEGDGMSERREVSAFDENWPPEIPRKGWRWNGVLGVHEVEDERGLHQMTMPHGFGIPGGPFRYYSFVQKS